MLYFISNRYLSDQITKKKKKQIYIYIYTRISLQVFDPTLMEQLIDGAQSNS
jgi:hypothetical protein